MTKRRRRWKRAKAPPERRREPSYMQIMRIVDGAVADAILAHPRYFVSNQAIGDARRSIVKRVTGSLVGYLAQKAKRGASGNLAGR